MHGLSLSAADQAPTAPEWTASTWFNHPTGLTLAGLRGRVVVLHAFQLLCPGCVLHGLPQAQRIRATFTEEAVAVVGMHTVFEHHDAMGPATLAAFLHEYRIGFPVAVDTPVPGRPVPKTMADYALRGTPSLVLIDRAGRLRLNAFGRPDDLAVGAAIAALVAEGPGGCDPEGCRAPGL